MKLGGQALVVPVKVVYKVAQITAVVSAGSVTAIRGGKATTVYRRHVRTSAVVMACATHTWERASVTGDGVAQAAIALNQSAHRASMANAKMD